MSEYADKKLNIVASGIKRGGFSLIEIITVMVISSMVMISALGIFNRVKSATISVHNKLNQEDVADEILQRIAEDLDRLACVGFDTTVKIKNKMSNGFNKSQLIIENKFYDKRSKAKTFEKIIWQSEYDILEGMTILYRHHDGISMEDKILDGELEEKQAGNKALYIPICWGMTLFQIVVPKKDADPLKQWSSATLPTSVAVTISFAEPMENFDGTMEVAEEDMITRHIAINRTRMPRFVFKKKDFTKPELDSDPNDIDDYADDDADTDNGDGDESNLPGGNTGGDSMDIDKTNSLLGSDRDIKSSAGSKR